jgi:hypothetical protein
MKLSILTYCSGYQYEIYERFAGSLYDTGFTGTLYFVILPSDKPNVERLQTQYPNIKIIIDTLERTTAFFTHRYKVFLNHIGEIEGDYVFMTDSRDVLFQKNPEDFLLTDDIYVFEEDVLIKDEPVNTMWIKDLSSLMGIDIFSSICNNPVLCGGTTFCSNQSLSHYLTVMNDIINLITLPPDYVMDQAIHNYMIYYELLNPFSIKILNNRDNFVNTIAISPHKLLNSDNKIVNCNNEVSYIVHQYDRCDSEFRTRISSKYNFTI